MVGIQAFPIGFRPIFRGENVSFREGKHQLHSFLFCESLFKQTSNSRQKADVGEVKGTPKMNRKRKASAFFFLHLEMFSTNR